MGKKGFNIFKYISLTIKVLEAKQLLLTIPIESYLDVVIRYVTRVLGSKTTNLGLHTSPTHDRFGKAF